MSEINALLHAGLLVGDLARAKRFYEAVLGLTPSPARPELPYPGEWYDLPGGQQLHLMNLPNPDAHAVRPEHGGRDRHIALGVRDLEALKSRLQAAGMGFSVSKSGRAALFCRDPDGNTLEFVEIG
ncbi:MAG: glyoxalase [Hydrogenophilales bacterium 16-64-46]|nr:MAG: glyoxalase [Hydrogenophilales bacterium 12-64-13]OYZ05673.1 MAG: glyoxalase [Hydrogenophilales bacterium 16-64-46]OZA40252.1 MAG: glyoxalase [Hydrogenophilales bacterium 17-64-34]HQT00803.1 VOC family protein [Thiobacillus sp.]